ncbi:FMN-dependent dehydrogenase [Fructobacillus evanidus]|uniref:Isopentenyl-diphosphate delta-isomerase n=2 Tax=Fructobacillus evanidus TaxID=3064281 RepID=A0ABN9YI85_9LACO|nr:FMN-dependent dehydrogenase [Fructobacillus sp. LMG 32999]CAK1222419.1 FMN-dependent dehydrogenase [Fructobacillus sp. LMG 32999]CAK1224563.1 FMN-dependent dehydrogenase [Fructobacillus sp. LMG 32999]CAK1224752.1 FMN-dependent dehydrogenase [Fructobacillus sp. LMG 32999]CAK1224920.1 FMN-dependent dehydrogenase [Fructobacillus sp. LMG 32999]
MATTHSNRKNEHLSLATKFWRDQENPVIGPGFDAVRWVPGPLKDMAVTDVQPTTHILGADFAWPFYIEAMTGGSVASTKVNADLATVAQKMGLAMAVGSQSVALKDSSQVESYRVVRQNHPEGFLIANLGADHPIQNVQAAIDMIDANAIELHVNLGQELAMAEGDRRFYWLDNLATVIAKSPVPVIIKEVGFGMGPDLLKQLSALKPAAINVGGGNGTSFAQIEQRRDRQNENPLDLSPFGLSTVESLLAGQKAAIDSPLIATGGIQSINDVVTALILGAKTTSSAGHFLQILMTKNPSALQQEIENWQQALPELMTLLGAKTIADLSQVPRLYRADLQNSSDQL